MLQSQVKYLNWLRVKLGDQLKRHNAEVAYYEETKEYLRTLAEELSYDVTNTDFRKKVEEVLVPKVHDLLELVEVSYELERYWLYTAHQFTVLAQNEYNRFLSSRKAVYHFPQKPNANAKSSFRRRQCYGQDNSIDNDLATLSEDKQLEIANIRIEHTMNLLILLNKVNGHLAAFNDVYLDEGRVMVQEYKNIVTNAERSLLEVDGNNLEKEISKINDAVVKLQKEIASGSQCNNDASNDLNSLMTAFSKAAPASYERFAKAMLETNVGLQISEIEPRIVCAITMPQTEASPHVRGACC